MTKLFELNYFSNIPMIHMYVFRNITLLRKFPTGELSDPTHLVLTYKFLFTIYCLIVCLFFPLRFSFPYYTTSSEGSVRIEFYSLYISIFCVLILIKPNQLGTARTRCTFLINRYKFIILLFCFT